VSLISESPSLNRPGSGVHTPAGSTGKLRVAEILDNLPKLQLRLTPQPPSLEHAAQTIVGMIARSLAVFDIFHRTPVILFGLQHLSIVKSRLPQRQVRVGPNVRVAGIGGFPEIGRRADCILQSEFGFRSEIVSPSGLSGSTILTEKLVGFAYRASVVFRFKAILGLRKQPPAFTRGRATASR